MFRSSEKPPVQPTPLPDSEAQTDSGQSTNASARYRYLSPFKPQPGNRPEAEGMLAQGVRAQEAGSLPEAIKAYQKATELDPSFFEAHYNLGLALTGSGALSTALAAYEGALAIRPDSLDARYNFALLLKRANYLADAISQLDQVLSRSPSEVRAHLALGNIYAQQMQQPPKARQHYIKVLELDARHAEANAIRYWLAANP